MFTEVRGFLKEDLRVVAEEVGESVPPNVTIAKLKEIILSSKEYENDPVFVKEVLLSTINERKLQKERQQAEEEKEEKRRQAEEEKVEKHRQVEEEKDARRFELEKLRMEHELEIAKVHAINRQNQIQVSLEDNDDNVPRRKFTLPRLEFRQFSGDIKEWLPFWCQFQQIDQDEAIALEDKFQYLVQATIPGSRAREVVESFPPTSANYSKVIESLKARFGREDLLVEVYVRELLKLIISVQSKERFSLTSLYDKLESYLRALETLGVTTDKCASILYPLVESCFPEEFLKAWNRSTISSSKKDAKERLNNLMEFFKSEVEGEERINLAIAGFGLAKNDGTKFKNRKQDSTFLIKGTSTASALFANKFPSMKKSCVFCQGKHASADCFTAQKMSLPEKLNVLKEKNSCFACLIPGHSAKKCRLFLKCILCGKKHVTLMCSKLESHSDPIQKKEDEKSPANEVNMSNCSQSPTVFLQTLKANLISGNKKKSVRILLDSGSQRSYVLQDIAKEMNYLPLHQETVRHALFGGVTTKECKHQCYKIRLANLDDTFRCNFEVLDEDKICENIFPVSQGPWLDELKAKNIILTDVSDTSESIHVLVGADIMGKLLTGRREELTSGLIAIETRLGWSLMGKVPLGKSQRDNLAMTVTSLFVKEAEIADLWQLDLIGIKDPIEKVAKTEKDMKTKEHFLETVKFNEDNRYEIQLPWNENSTTLPDNFYLAEKRLEKTTTKLLENNLYPAYESVLLDWLKEGIIETVPPEEVNLYGHYLPHRPVIKLTSSTTPIRPVFDASAKTKDGVSLNQSLQCGPNLIELIPDILLRFRKDKIGVTADIRKAFLQVSVHKKDRDFLRFLWWENSDRKKYKYFRHTRVVFGVKCSPFLLGAVIEYHINQNEDFDAEFRNKLQRSFYVDNVVTSISDEAELHEFVSSSIQLMKMGGFDLRCWESSSESIDNLDNKESSVLGLKWNRHSDTLRVNMSWLKEINLEKITKRVILSVAHRVFDPIGYTSPIMLYPKLLLQRAWKLGITWDEEIKEDIQKDFLQWFQDLKLLGEIFIPRWMLVTPENVARCSIHTFCDASQDAYAAAVFLRIKEKDGTKLILLAAKSRVSPLKVATIPRLELLAALVGARLTNSVIEALDWKEVPCYYWSDSTTVIAWISRLENWAVFVRNRVEEIRKLSKSSSWHHIPGEKNPADILTRECKIKHFVSTKWWEGPKWLKEEVVPFDKTEELSQVYDEEEILKEKSKSISLSTIEKIPDQNWYYKYFSSYPKIIRTIAWILRFKYNCLSKNETKRRGEIACEEFDKAEKIIMKMIQQECLVNEENKFLKTLAIFKDDEGIFRVKTKIIYRNDNEDFKTPIVLPSEHDVVKRLIISHHEKHMHCGLQTLLNVLREKFWILQARKTVRKVISKCVICKRFSSKRLESVPASLPEDRICDAAVFQITGIDTAGPLYLKGNQKSWIILFTCAIYRAVHLELVTSLTTEAFLMALRRFVARRGRCSTIYCDNGTNFVGASNLLSSLDWNEIVKYGAVNAINWKFNPPTAAWWGGWWERLIRLMKDVLKRVLGRALLSQEEMSTVLCDCEAVMNSRPLTYLSECDTEVMPITPAMFLHDIKEWKVPDLDSIDRSSLNRRIRYRQALQRSLRNRFRSEYLGVLVQHGKAKQNYALLSIGDVVLIGSDNTKRINWPLGRIIQLLPGKDGHVRLVKIQTATNALLRPIQRVYPLEISSINDCPATIASKIRSLKHVSISEKDDENIASESSQTTRAGRRVKIPERLIMSFK